MTDPTTDCVISKDFALECIKNETKRRNFFILMLENVIIFWPHHNLC